MPRTITYRRLTADIDNPTRDRRRKYGANRCDVYKEGWLFILTERGDDESQESRHDRWWIDGVDFSGDVYGDIARAMLDNSKLVTLSEMTDEEAARAITARFSWRPDSLIRALIRSGIDRRVIESALIADHDRPD